MSVAAHRREKRNLVASVAEQMRERIFACEPDERLGSLTELAASLDVGIVTIQQAARILEHEGLLDVRRGPGGGYYGRRPDEAALERALAAYIRLHPDSLDEALDITSLLFTELCGAAAGSPAEDLRLDLKSLSERIARCEDMSALGNVELDLQNLLFRMVDRPIFELLTRVTLRFAATSAETRLYRGADGIARWRTSRLRVIAAIVGRDQALARFEADRGNRQEIVAGLLATTAPAPRDR